MRNMPYENGNYIIVLNRVHCHELSPPSSKTIHDEILHACILAHGGFYSKAFST